MFDVCNLLLVLSIPLFLTLPPHLNSCLNHVLASGRGNHSGLFVSLRVLIIAHWEVSTTLQLTHLLGTFFHCLVYLWEVLLRTLEYVLGLSEIYIVLRNRAQMNIIRWLLQGKSVNLSILFYHESMRVSSLCGWFLIFFCFQFRCFMEGSRWLILFWNNSYVSSNWSCGSWLNCILFFKAQMKIGLSHSFSNFLKVYAFSFDYFRAIGTPWRSIYSI